IEEIEVFARRWWPWAERLGLGEQTLRVLGDGAEGIWEHAELEFAHWRGRRETSHRSAGVCDQVHDRGREGGGRAERVVGARARGGGRGVRGGGGGACVKGRGGFGAGGGGGGGGGRC